MKKNTREGDVGENLRVQETKRAAELKTLYKGFKDVSGNRSKVSCNSLFEKGTREETKSWSEGSSK